jgi:putative OPT family oligopeptide transporter
MAILRYFRGHSILENNIVQTIASAAGTLAAIIFVLPGLIMIGWWQGFPYWTTVAVCVIGGTLGVMYSVPLRRALVTGSDLPYPEGVAAAEVLRVGEATEGTAAGAEGNRAACRRSCSARWPRPGSRCWRRSRWSATRCRRRSGSARAAPCSGPASRWR